METVHSAWDNNSYQETTEIAFNHLRERLLVERLALKWFTDAQNSVTGNRISAKHRPITMTNDDHSPFRHVWTVLHSIPGGIVIQVVPTFWEMR